MASSSSPRSARAKRRQASDKASSAASPRRQAAMVFTRTNYLLMLLGVVLVIIGYVIMRVENEVDGFISLYIAPLLILGGYLEIIYAILWRPKEEAGGVAIKE